MTNDVVIQENGALGQGRPATATYSYAPQAMAGLAGEMVTAGLSVLEAQQIVAHIQEVAQNAALGAAPKMLEAVRKANEERMLDLMREVRMLSADGVMGKLGYVSRDRVLQLIQMAASTTPRAARL